MKKTHQSHALSLETITLETLLAQHAEEIRRIRLGYGVSPQQFTAEVQPIIERYAAWVHLLPATAAQYFYHAGGLLQLGLNTALYCVQGSDAHLFAGRSSISRRRHMEPRWKLAIFIAGLCNEVHRSVSHWQVHAGDHQRWPAYEEPLLTWLSHNALTRYSLSWSEGMPGERALALYALPHLVPPHVLTYLADNNPVIVPELLMSIGGNTVGQGNHLIGALVQRAQALAIDQQSSPAPTTASIDDLREQLLSAIHYLLDHHPAWAPNGKKSRLWIGLDGVFLTWPGAINDLSQHLERLGGMNLPLEVEALTTSLSQLGLLNAPRPDSTLWTIWLSESSTQTQALKWQTPALLFSSTAPPSVLPFNLLTQRATVTPPLPQLPLDLDPNHADETILLNAPLRLLPAVREVLTTVLDTLSQSHDSPLAHLTEQGLFVPHETFAQLGVPPTQAIRALEDAGMLVEGLPSDNAGASAETRGLIIKSTFLSGLQ